MKGLKCFFVVVLALVLSFAALAQAPNPVAPADAAAIAAMQANSQAAVAAGQAGEKKIALEKLPSFEVYLGIGQVAVSETGNAVAYTANFQTQLTAGARFFITPRFAIEAQYFHDTVSVARWLTAHSFTPYKQIDAYHYSALAMQAEYWLIRNDKGGLYGFVAPQYFFSTNGVNGALGYAAGFGGSYVIWKGLFVESKAQFWHVQEYIVPVANTCQGSISIGYRF